MRVLSLFVFCLAAAIALPCTQNSDCGSQDATQPGLCVSGTCQCGFGYSPDREIDPTSCSLTCSPPPVPDGTAFLLEPNVTVTAIAGNFSLGVNIQPFKWELPATIALRNPVTGSSCAIVSAQLGQGVIQQALDTADGACNTDYVYQAPFAAEVGNADCWVKLDSTETEDPQQSVTYDNFQTQVQVFQTGLAPFQSASRSARTDPPLATITRDFARDYTIQVATSFTATSQEFSVFQANQTLNRTWAAVDDYVETKQTESVLIPATFNDIPGTANQTDFFANGTSTSTTSNTPIQSLNVVQGPAHGTVTLGPLSATAAAFTYAPTGLFYGEDSFTYTITDSVGVSNTATVHVTVKPVYPTCSAGGFTAICGATIDLDTVGLTTPGPGGLAKVNIKTGPSANQGSATVAANNNISFTADVTYVGSAITLSFESCDASAPALCSQPCTITVSIVSSGPSASAISIRTDENVPITLNVLDAVTTQCAALNVSSLSISTPAHGTISIAAGSVTYTPNQGYYGPEDLTFNVCDLSQPQAQCNGGPLNIAITPVGPTCGLSTTATCYATGTSVDVKPDNKQGAQPLQWSALQIDRDDESLSYSNGVFTYSPPSGFSGVKTFGYRVCDNSTGPDGPLCCDGTVSITVKQPCYPTAPSNAYLNTPQNTAVSFTPAFTTCPTCGFSMVSSTLSVIRSPLHGSTSIVDGEITYTPSSCFYGNDEYKYEQCDAAGVCSDSTVFINVDPVYPKAHGDFANATYKQTIAIRVLDNDDRGACAFGQLTILPGIYGGTATANGQLVSFTAAPNFDGSASFQYQICDGSYTNTGAIPLCDTAPVHVQVTGLPCVASPDDARRDLGATSMTLDVTFNDVAAIDSALNKASVLLNTTGLCGTATVNANGIVTYTPRPNWIGSETFSYQVWDTMEPTPLSCSAPITVAVDAVQPQARDDSTSTSYQGSVEIGVLANDDRGPSGFATLVSASVVDPIQGTATIIEGSKISFTAAINWNGVAQVVYKICDATVTKDANSCTSPAPQCSQATLRIQVNETAPVCVQDERVIDEDSGSLSISVLDNDGQPGAALNRSSLKAGAPQWGTAQVINGAISYTPGLHCYGVDTFSYTVFDVSTPFVLSCSAQVSVTVKPKGPFARTDSANTTYTTPVTIHVLTNDDAGSGPQAVTLVQQSDSRYGTASVNAADNSITFTPAANFDGEASFSYRVCDSSRNCGSSQSTTSLCSEATVFVSVTELPCIAASDDAELNQDGWKQQLPLEINVLANDKTLSSPLNVSSITVGARSAGGVVSVGADGRLLYTPPTHYHGADTFTYRVCTSNTPTASCCDSSVQVNVIGVPPVAAALLINSTYKGTVTIDAILSGVTAGPAGISGLFIGQGPTAQEGTATVSCNAGGYCQIQFTAATNFGGSATFTYYVCDNSSPTQLCSSKATITVVITEKPCTAASDSASASEGGSPFAIRVLSNDVFPGADADILSLSLLKSSGVGSFQANADGTLTYTPPAKCYGLAQAHYQICDQSWPKPLCCQGSADVQVDPVPPEAEDDADSVDYRGSVTMNVTKNDRAGPGGIVSLTISGLDSAQGSASVTSDLQIVFTAATNFNGLATFRYTITDGSCVPLTASASVSVVVYGKAPICAEDTAQAQEDATAFGIAVLGNDKAAPGSALNTTSLRVLSQPEHGSAIAANGQLTFTPGQHWYGTFYVSYEVNDTLTPNALSCNTTVAVTIDPVPWVCASFITNTSYQGTLLINVVAKATSGPAPLANVTIVSVTQGSGTAFVTPQNEISFTAAANFGGGTAYIQYTIQDQSLPTALSCSAGTVAVHVAGCPPVAVPDTYEVLENSGSIALQVLDNDRLPCPGTALNPASVTVLSGQTLLGGTVIANADGTITYTPPADCYGLDQFKYSVNDTETPTAQRGETSVSITITYRKPSTQSDSDTVDYLGTKILDVLANDQAGSAAFGKLTISVAPLPSGSGTASVTSDRKISFTAAQNFNGIAAFTYQICDTSCSLLCETGQVSVTVRGSPPRCHDHLYTIAQNAEATTFDVLADARAATGSSINAASLAVSGFSHGSASVVNGKIVYTPTTGFYGTDSAGYNVSDTMTPAALAVQCQIFVIIAKRPPTCNPARAETNYLVPVSYNALALNAAGAQPLQLATVSFPANPMLSYNGAGTFTLTPAAGFYGTFAFNYTVQDDSTPNPLSCTTTMTFSVGAPKPPTCHDITATKKSGTPDTEVLSSWVRQGATALNYSTLAILSQPADAHGSITLNRVAGSITYTPTTSPYWYGYDTYEYSVCDQQNLCCNATAEITYTQVCHTAQDDAATVLENGSVNINVLQNDAVSQSGWGGLSITSAPINGTATVIEANNTIQFTPLANYDGSWVTFQYSICNTEWSNSEGSYALKFQPCCQVATVNVTINATSPTCVNYLEYIVQAQPTVLFAPLSTPNIVIAGTSAINASSIRLTLNDIGPLKGTAVANSNGTISYTATPRYYTNDATGPDYLSYSVCDVSTPSAKCVTGCWIKVIIKPVPPSCQADSASTPYRTAVVIAALANDTAGALPIDRSSVTHNGINVTYDRDTGSFRYTPPATVHSTFYSFQYTEYDNSLPSPLMAMCAVTVEVGSRIYPTCRDFGISLKQSQTVTSSILQYVAVQAGGAPLRASSLSVNQPPSHGTTLIDSPAFAIQYRADQCYYGIDKFSYQICDDLDLCCAGIVSVTTGPWGPQAQNDYVTVPYGECVTIDVLRNDTAGPCGIVPTTLSILEAPSPATGSVSLSLRDRRRFAMGGAVYPHYVNVCGRARADWIAALDQFIRPLTSLSQLSEKRGGNESQARVALAVDSLQVAKQYDAWLRAYLYAGYAQEVQAVLGQAERAVFEAAVEALAEAIPLDCVPWGEGSVKFSRSPWQRYTGFDDCPGGLLHGYLPGLASFLVNDENDVNDNEDYNDNVDYDPEESCVAGKLLGDCQLTGLRHGDARIYEEKTCPGFPAIPADGSGWEEGKAAGITDRESIDFGCRKCSVLRSCLENQVNVNFFQTFINVPKAVGIREFYVVMDADDGARLTIINADGVESSVLNANDGSSTGSYVYADGVKKSQNLAKYLTSGQNRLIITKIDDCQRGNWLSGVRIIIDGELLENATVTVTDVTPPNFGGTVSSGSSGIATSASGNITFCAALNFDGLAEFVYQVCDGSSPYPSCTTALVEVQVGNGTKPTILPVTGQINEDGWTSGAPLDLPMLNGATAVIGSTINNASLFVGSIGQTSLATANGGSVTAYPNGTCKYVPPLHWYGIDTFTFGACDTQFPYPQCSTATATVTVVQQPPSAKADYATVSYMGTVFINVLSNDTAGPAGLDRVTISTAPSSAQGSATVQTDKTIKFTAAPNFAGTASFQYCVYDVSRPTNLHSCSSLTVVVSGDNPVCVNGEFSVNQGQWTGTANSTTPYTFNAKDFASPSVGSALNFTTLSMVAGKQPSLGGRVIFASDGTITYTPPAQCYGTDEFTYFICDTKTPDSQCCQSTFTVQIRAQPPKTTPDSAWVDYSKCVNIPVLDNDNAGPEGFLTLTAFQDPTPNRGTASAEANNTITFCAAQNFNGVARFNYQVCDNSRCNNRPSTPALCSDPTPVEVKVSSYGCVATNKTASLSTGNQTAPQTVTIDVWAGALPAPGSVMNTSSVSILTNAQRGSLAILPSGSVTYTSSNRYYGTDSFVYQICDQVTPTADCCSGTVTVTVNPVPPKAQSDSALCNYTGTVVIKVLDNDQLGSGGLASVTISTPPPTNEGSATVLSDNTISFTAAINFNGVALFAYTITDNSNPTPLTSTAWVNVTILGVPCIGVADEYWVNQDGWNGTASTGLPLTLPVTVNDGRYGAALNLSSVSIQVSQAAAPPSVVIDGVISPGEWAGATTVVIGNGGGRGYLLASGSYLYAALDITGWSTTTSWHGNLLGFGAWKVNGGHGTSPGVEIHQSTTRAAWGSTATGPISGILNTWETAWRINNVIQESIPSDLLAKDAFSGGTATNRTRVWELRIPIGTLGAAPGDTIYVVGGINFAARSHWYPDYLMTPPAWKNYAPVKLAEAAATLYGSATPNSDGTINYRPPTNFYGDDTFVYKVCDVAFPNPLCCTAQVTIHVTKQPPTAAALIKTVEYRSTTIIDVFAAATPGPAPLVNVTAGSVPTSQGLVSVSNNKIVYAAADGFNGIATFSYTIYDSSVSYAGSAPLSSTATIQMYVYGCAPHAYSDQDSINEDGWKQASASLVIDVTSNDQACAGTALNRSTITISTQATLGTATAANGAVTYTPNKNTYGQDVFWYTVCDTVTPTRNCSAPAYVNVTIVPQPWQAFSDYANTTYMAAVDVDVKGNDVAGPASLAATNGVQIVSGPTAAQGIAAVLADGKIRYTPAQNWNGQTSFTYKLLDQSLTPGLFSNEATVTIYVSGCPPLLGADSRTIDEDSAAISIPVLDNDVAPCSSQLNASSVTVADQPCHGTASVLADGSIRYVVASNFYGQDRLKYQVYDQANPTPLSSKENVVVNINGLAPKAKADAYNLGYMGTEDYDVLANDAPGPAGFASLSIVNPPPGKFGQAQVVNNRIRFTAAPNFDGTASIEYQVCDSSRSNDLSDPCQSTPAPLCATALVQVHVAHSGPSCLPIAITINQNDNATILDILANSQAAVGSSMNASSLVLSDAFAHGQATINTIAGTISYTPNKRYYGADGATYTIYDTETPTQHSCSGLITIKINGVGPTAVADTADTKYLIPVTINALANDKAGVQPIQTGSVTYTADPALVSYDGAGSFTYSPPPKFEGVFSFEYTECDDSLPLALCDTATVTITVGKANPPTCLSIRPLVISERDPAAWDLATLVRQGETPLNYSGTMQILSQPTCGTVSPAFGDSSFQGVYYVPPNDFFGDSGSWTFRVCDQQKLCVNCSGGTVVVDAMYPEPRNDQASTIQNTPVTIDVRKNDQKWVFSGQLTSVTVDPAKGSAIINSDETITFTPSTDYNGQVTFIYEDCRSAWNCSVGSSKLCATASVSVTILTTNPVANSFAAAVNENSLANVIQVASQGTNGTAPIAPDSVTLVTNFTHGTATVNADGSISYTPATGYYGPDSATYSVCDQSRPIQLCSALPGTITVDVKPLGPTANDVSASTAYNTPVTVNVIQNVTLGVQPLNTSSLTITQQPEHGTASINADGSITYTPYANYTQGPDTIRFQVCDTSFNAAGTPLCSIATLTVNVLGIGPGQWILRYRLVGINYDIINKAIVATIQTQTPKGSAVDNVQLSSLSAGLSPITNLTTGLCAANSSATTCDQYHQIVFADKPCKVSAATLALTAIFQCVNGAPASQCGYINYNAGGLYNLNGMRINYDACARVISFGVDTSKSSLRLYADAALTTAATVIQQGTSIYGRLNVFPTVGSVFQTVTITAVDLIQQQEGAPQNAGSLLATTDLTIAPIVSNDPSNPKFDLTLFINPTTFQPGSTYYLSVSTSLVFNNTGPILRRVLLPVPRRNSTLRAQNAAFMERVEHATRADAPTQGFFSNSFRMTAAAVSATSAAAPTTQASTEIPTTTAAASSSGSSSAAPIAIGVAIGVVALIAIIVVAVLLVRRKRRQQGDDDAAGAFQRVESRTSENDIGGLQ